MLRNRKGSSFVFVIAMVVMLAIVSTGFLYMTEFNTRTMIENQYQMQHYYLAKSVHRSICQAAESGTLEVLNEVVREPDMEADGDKPFDETEIGKAADPEAADPGFAAASTEMDAADEAYHISTGESEIWLENEMPVTIKIDLTCDTDPEAGIQVRIDTMVTFTDDDNYQFSALLVPAEGLEQTEGTTENRWIVWRHFEGDKEHGVVGSE